MKLINYFFFPLILIAIFIASCKDDNVTTTGNNGNVIDPTITITDQFGNILGGDTTDWCYSGGSGVGFNPAYPNPTNDTVNLHFVIAQPDVLTLYFLNSPTDTVFIWNSKPVQSGIFDLSLNSEALGYNNIIKRLYLKVMNHPNNSPYCRYYGDIQFY